jgi:hypothetical protein
MEGLLVMMVVDVLAPVELREGVLGVVLVGGVARRPLHQPHKVVVVVVVGWRVLDVAPEAQQQVCEPALSKAAVLVLVLSMVGVGVVTVSRQ